MNTETIKTHVFTDATCCNPAWLSVSSKASFRVQPAAVRRLYAFLTHWTVSLHPHTDQQVHQDKLLTDNGSHFFFWVSETLIPPGSEKKFLYNSELTKTSRVVTLDRLLVTYKAWPVTIQEILSLLQQSSWGAGTLLDRFWRALEQSTETQHAQRACLRQLPHSYTTHKLE